MVPSHIRKLLAEHPNLHVSVHPVILDKFTKLCDKRTRPKKFREYLREISTLLMYEATQDFALSRVVVDTPLDRWRGYTLKDKIGLAPILRAGLGMVEGVHLIHPGAEVWHLGLYRDEMTKKPIWYYKKLPVSPTVDVCFVLDPMLATGGSAVATVDALKEWGAKRIVFVGLEAAPMGVRKLSKAHPDVPIYVAYIGRKLNKKAYILDPSVGDAGDRQNGTG